MRAIDVRKILSREKLYELYVNKQLSPNDIARQYGCSDFLIRTLFREFGIIPRIQRNGRNIALQSGKFNKRKGIKSTLTSKKLQNLYFDKKLSFEDIARRYGCTSTYIRKLFYQYGLVPRNRSEARREVLKARKLTHGYYTINENFFEKWSPEMAYVLGIYATDGCLQDLKYTKTNSLSAKDEEFLKKVRALMHSNYPIRRQPNNKTSFIYCLTFSNQKVFKDILKLGITPKKSLTLKFPSVPPDYLRHFIRGVVDGDGWVGTQSYYADGRTESHSSTGLHPWLSGAWVNTERLYQYGKIFRLNYESQECLSLFRYIYENVPKEMYHERKFITFKEGLKRAKLF